VPGSQLHDTGRDPVTVSADSLGQVADPVLLLMGPRVSLIWRRDLPWRRRVMACSRRRSSSCGVRIIEF